MHEFDDGVGRDDGIGVHGITSNLMINDECDNKGFKYGFQENSSFTLLHLNIDACKLIVHE